MEQITGPCKLMIRGFPEEGVIRAWCAMIDNPEERFELSTLSYQIAHEDRANFDAWV